MNGIGISPNCFPELREIDYRESSSMTERTGLSAMTPKYFNRDGSAATAPALTTFVSTDPGTMGDLRTLVLPSAEDIDYVRAADYIGVFAGLVFFDLAGDPIGDCTAAEEAACGVDRSAANPACIERCHNDYSFPNKITTDQSGPTVAGIGNNGYVVWHPEQTWPDPTEMVLIGFASHNMFAPEFTSLSFVFVTRV